VGRRARRGHAPLPGGHSLVGTAWWAQPGGHSLVGTAWWAQPGGQRLVEPVEAGLRRLSMKPFGGRSPMPFQSHPRTKKVSLRSAHLWLCRALDDGPATDRERSCVSCPGAGGVPGAVRRGRWRGVPPAPVLVRGGRGHEHSATACDGQNLWRKNADAACLCTLWTLLCGERSLSRGLLSTHPSPSALCISAVSPGQVRLWPLGVLATWSWG